MVAGALLTYEAELITFGVRHEDGVLMLVHQLCSQFDESAELSCRILSPQIKVNAVLHRLSLGHELEEESRTTSRHGLNQNSGIGFDVTNPLCTKPRKLSVVVWRNLVAV